MKVHATQIVVNSITSKKNLGFIIGFQNHSISSCEKPAIDEKINKKNLNKKNIYFNHTYNKLQILQLVDNWKRRSPTFLKIICLK
jgi:hypothetical protein